MKLAKGTRSASDTNLTITNGFDDANYHTIPSTFTKVANYGNGVQIQTKSDSAIFNKDAFVGALYEKAVL